RLTPLDTYIILICFNSPNCDIETPASAPKLLGMAELASSLGDRRADLMAALLREKGGLTVDALADTLGVTRTAVRQHLVTLERDGHVARGGTRPTGGRPEVLYVLTELGAEQFERRYSWFADLLIGLLKTAVGDNGLRRRLRELGAGIAASAP